MGKRLRGQIFCAISIMMQTSILHKLSILLLLLNNSLTESDETFRVLL